ncbi:MAG: hypothetical protein IJ872_01865 [Eubacterium sp.]|nr:hypothetical protein [Eubacterium sp.]
MMNVKVNESILNIVLNDEIFKSELIEFLNEVVDAELEKGDEMDTDLIEDCTEIIFDLENGYEVMEFEREKAEKIIRLFNNKTEKKKINYKKVLIAAIAAIMAMTATTTVFADEINYFLHQIVDIINEVSEGEDFDDKYISLIFVPPDGAPTTVKSKKDINLEGYYCVVFCENGDEKTVPISDCQTIIKKTTGDDGKKKYTVAAYYKGAKGAISFDIEED